MKAGDIFKITISEDNPNWAEGVSYLKLYEFSGVGKTKYDKSQRFWACFWGNHGESLKDFLERDKTFETWTGGNDNRRLVKTNITFSEDWINNHGEEEIAEREK